jgi:hypothetical protein
MLISYFTAFVLFALTGGDRQCLWDVRLTEELLQINMELWDGVFCFFEMHCTDLEPGDLFTFDEIDHAVLTLP